MVRVQVSIITCRRVEWLKKLLDTLYNQETGEGIQFDVLVVDNALDNNTKELLAKYKSHPNGEYIYDVEPTPGIVFARNKCVARFLENEYDYLIFIDDDEWPKYPDWILNLVTAQKKYQVDVVTSHVESVGEKGVPDWAVDLIYGNNTLYEGQSITTFYTNNLLLTRNIVEASSPLFDERFAMTGASDYHYALKAKKSGFKAVYTNAPVEEIFPKERANFKWFLKRGFRSGIGYTRSHIFEDGRFVATLKAITFCGIRLLRSLAYGLKGIVTFDKRELVNSAFRASSAVGTVMGLFGVQHQEYLQAHKK